MWVHGLRIDESRQQYQDTPAQWWGLCRAKLPAGHRSGIQGHGEET